MAKTNKLPAGWVMEPTTDGCVRARKWFNEEQLYREIAGRDEASLIRSAQSAEADAVQRALNADVQKAQRVEELRAQADALLEAAS